MAWGQPKKIETGSSCDHWMGLRRLTLSLADGFGAMGELAPELGGEMVAVAKTTGMRNLSDGFITLLQPFAGFQ